MVSVELIYIAKDKTIAHHILDLPAGVTVADALRESGIYDSHPETLSYSVGIFSKKTTFDTLLRNGDRVEIYRPLLCDPKENRRQRVGKR